MKKTINFLLNESCPSIQYRVNKEILGNKINYLQSKILDDPEVRVNDYHKLTTCDNKKITILRIK